MSFCTNCGQDIQEDEATESIWNEILGHPDIQHVTCPTQERKESNG